MEEDENIAITASIAPFTPCCIRFDLDLNVLCPRYGTVDRRLREAGLYGRVARHKRVYAAAEIRARLAFAEGYSRWTPEQWSRVLFSDEKSFYGRGFCNRPTVSYCSASVRHSLTLPMSARHLRHFTDAADQTRV